MKISLTDLLLCRNSENRRRFNDDKTAVSRSEMKALLAAHGVRKVHHFKQVDGTFRLDVCYRGAHFVCAARDNMASLFPRSR
ncbi:MAG: hypothetical protein V1489_02550 [Candidatus Liptonbacteria bacterium]